MKPQALTISSTLSKRLTAIFSQKHVNFFVLNGLKNDAKKLLNTNDAFIGYAYLGIVAAIEGNKELVDDYFYKSLNMTNSAIKYGVYYNYISALGRACMFDRRIDILKSLLNVDVSDLVYLQDFIPIFIFSGLYESAAKMVCKLKELGLYTFEDMSSSIELFSLNGFNEEYAIELMLRLNKLAIEKYDLFITGIDSKTFLDEDNSTYRELHFSSSMEDNLESIMEFDIAMTEVSVDFELEKGLDFSNIIFSCSRMEVE